MAKGYWVAHGTVTDAAMYENYKAAARDVLARYGAQFVVRGGDQSVVEGDARPRTVVIAFPSYADALACYDDPDYQKAKAIRAAVASSDLVIVEGYDG